MRYLLVFHKKGDIVFRVPNPNIQPDPTHVRYEQLIKYRGLDDKRRFFAFKNMKASWRALLGLTGAAILGMSVGTGIGKTKVHGKANIGGEILVVQTKNDDDDINYNREFQRAGYLSVPGLATPSTVDSYILADLGLKETNLPAGDFKKRAPHYKYY